VRPTPLDADSARHSFPRYASASEPMSTRLLGPSSKRLGFPPARSSLLGVASAFRPVATPLGAHSISSVAHGSGRASLQATGEAAIACAPARLNEG
jgi:hypothetical protein